MQNIIIKYDTLKSYKIGDQHCFFLFYLSIFIHLIIMFRNLFKKKVKTILPGSEQHEPDTSKQTIKIKPEFAYLIQLEKCLEQSCILSHLSFIDEEEIEHIINTVKQLLKISDSLKTQQLENNQLRKFYDSNRHIVSNHTNIVKGIEAMYEDRMATIRDEHLKTLEDKDNDIEDLRVKLESMSDKNSQLEEQNISLKADCDVLKQKAAQLEFAKNKLLLEVEILKKDILIYQSVKDNSKIQLDTLSVKEPITILLQSSISDLMFSLLSVKDILQLSELNKLSYHIISHNIDINRTLMKKSFQETAEWRKNTIKDIKYFQSMVQNINDYSIKQSALKYIYFHQKPGEYMLPTFKQFNIEEQKQKQKEKQEEKKKRKTSFFGLFDTNKDKKDEGKISIKDLADPAYFKRVESKIEQYFNGIIDMKEDEPLKVFRENMLEQYQDLKKIILHQNQMIKMYQCSKFLYLESQELLRFSQFLYSMYVQLSKKHQIMKSEYDDIVEKEQSMKNTLQIISSEKNKTQELNWLLQYDLTKQKLALQTKQKQLAEAHKEVEKYKENYEKTKTQSIAINKKNEDLFKKVTKLDKYLQSIKALMLGEQNNI